MMRSAEIAFGQWLPDAPDFNNPGCVVADNCIPTPGGYGPLPGFVAQGDTVTGDVKGARQIFDNSGNSVIVGGTDDRLFIRRSSITETTGLSSLGSGEFWDFAQYDDFVIATAANNAPQYLTDVDSDNTWSALTGSPPNAKRCAKVGEFLMLGNISGTPNRIQWSAYNNPDSSWASSRLTQAGFADLPSEYGEVQRIVGGRYAMVFQNRAVQRVSYVGPPTVWRVDPVSTDRGTIAPMSVVNIGYLTFFLAQDGFMVTNGASVEPLSNSRVNSWFFDTVDQSTIAQTVGAIDWQNQCVFWAFKTSGSDQYERFLIYSWAEGRFSSGTATTGYIVGTTLDGVDLDSLDAIYGDLDSIPYSLDSAEFAPKDRRLAAFVKGSTTSEYNTFTGDPLEAVWDTGEFQPSPGQRVFVSEAWPNFESDTWDMKFGLLIRGNRGSETATAEIETGWAGFAPVRGEGKKMAIRCRKPAGGTWRAATGVQLRFRGAGSR